MGAPAERRRVSFEGLRANCKGLEASWEPGGRDRDRQNTVFPVYGGTIGHCPLFSYASIPVSIFPRNGLTLRYIPPPGLHIIISVVNLLYHSAEVRYPHLSGQIGGSGSDGSSGAGNSGGKGGSSGSGSGDSAIVEKHIRSLGKAITQQTHDNLFIVM